MSCSICLGAFEEPVSVPCGHIYCSACLLGYIGTVQIDQFTASCPTCRTSFPIVSPELTLIPKQFHRFFVPGIRRVYLDQTLERKLFAAQAQIRALESQSDTLMQECERHMASARAHAQGEKDGQLEVYRLQRLLSQERKKTVDAIRDVQTLTKRCGELEKDAEDYKEQRQEDLDTISEMDDLRCLFAEEKKVSKQIKREANIWKEKYNESQEKLELYESKLTRPRFAKRTKSEDSSSDDLFNFDDDNGSKVSSKRTGPFGLSNSVTAPRPILPPPRKKFRSTVQTTTIKGEEKDADTATLDREDVENESEAGPSFKPFQPPPRLRVSREYFRHIPNYPPDRT